MTSKLLPCPFCGKPEEHFHRYRRQIGFDMYDCIRCYCCAETIGWTPEEAEKSWNTRATQPSIDHPGDVAMDHVSLDDVSVGGYYRVPINSGDSAALPSDIKEYCIHPEGCTYCAWCGWKDDNSDLLSPDHSHPVAYMRNEGTPNNLVKCTFTCPGAFGVYRHTDHSGGAGKVVLPDRIDTRSHHEEDHFYMDGWNACLDKVKELNQ